MEEHKHKPNNKGNRQNMSIRKGSLLKLRVTILEKAMIERLADFHKLSTSEYMRRKALSQQLPKPLTEEEMKYKNLLIKTTANFIHLSNLIKQKHPDRAKETFRIIELFKTEIEKLN